MYAVKKEGEFSGYADSIVFIRLHSNGCYVPCEKAEADGRDADRRGREGISGTF